jgi:hypothetical protein
MESPWLIAYAIIILAEAVPTNCFLGYVLYKLIKSEQNHTLMIWVLSLLFVSGTCVIGLTIFVNWLKEFTYAETVIYGIVEFLGYLFNAAAMWLFCFKYWQTAFELNFLFRFDQP